MSPLNDEFVDYYKIFPPQFDQLEFGLREIIIINFLHFIFKLKPHKMKKTIEQHQSSFE
jgi:hypothetical protein